MRLNVMNTQMNTLTQPSELSAANNSNPGVLVVGDWLVDEHWVVGDHRWPSSSRIGLRHSRALHSNKGSVRSLCGAGQVATILYQAQSACSDHFMDVFGLGSWHPGDTLSLANMLNPSNSQRKTPHRIIHTEDPNPV